MTKKVKFVTWGLTMKSAEKRMDLKISSFLDKLEDEHRKSDRAKPIRERLHTVKLFRCACNYFMFRLTKTFIVEHIYVKDILGRLNEEPVKKVTKKKVVKKVTKKVAKKNANVCKKAKKVKKHK